MIYSDSDEVQEVEQGEASTSTEPKSVCGSSRPVQVINCPTCYKVFQQLKLQSTLIHVLKWLKVCLAAGEHMEIYYGISY